MARRNSVVVPSTVSNPIRRLSNVSFVPPPRNMRRMSTQLYGLVPQKKSVAFNFNDPLKAPAGAGSPKAPNLNQPPNSPNAVEMAGLASMGRRGRRMSTDLYKVRSSARPPKKTSALAMGALTVALGTLSENEVCILIR